MSKYLTIKNGVLTKCKRGVIGEVIIPEDVTEMRIK